MMMRALCVLAMAAALALPTIAQDVPPAPPPAAPRETTPPPERKPEPARQEAPRPESAAPSSSPSGGGSFKVPDVSNWTVSDAIEYAENNRLVVVGIVAAIVLTFLCLGNIVGPGSGAKLGGRDVKPLPAPIWLFGAILLFIAPPLAAQFLREMPQVASGGDLRERALVQAGAVGAGILVGMALLFVMSRTAPKAGLKFKFSDVPIGLGSFLLALPIVMLASYGGVYLYQELTGEAAGEIAHETLQQIISNRSNSWAWLLAAVAILGSPVLEEILYRGFLQSALLRFTNGQTWIAILGTSAAFALVHRLSEEPVPWFALLPIFTLGLCMGVAYERTKRIGVPITMHVCFNAMNVALAWTTTA